MSSSTLTQILFNSLLDSPAIIELTARLLEKAVPIIKSHFTFSADEITKAYQESCRYSFVAISIGLDAPESLIKKIRHPKITREFAKQIEENYYKPFTKKNEETGVQSFSFVKPLKKWAKKSEKLFEIKEITEYDLSALIGHRETLAISDLILAQMEKIEPVDDTLAAFLRFNGLLGDSVLFFFREQFRKDARIQATQTALQQERLCIDIKNIQATLDDLKENQEKYPFLSEQIAQQVQYLEQWQVQHEQLLGFQNRFAHQLDEVLDWAKDVYTRLDEIEEDVAETKETVIKTQGLAEEMNQKLDDILAAQLQNDSAQINHRDGTVQYAPENRALLKALLPQLQRLSPQHPLYGQVSNKAGRLLSSCGALGKAERLCVLLCQNQNELTKAEYPQVVVKCFWENISGDLKTVFKEPFSMHKLIGENIPKPLDYGYADNIHQKQPYFVTEYIDGAIDGEAWLEKVGAFDLTTGLQVAVQIAKALQRAHEKGICHLDLKPAR